MSKAIAWTKLWVTWLTVSLAAPGCGSQSRSGDTTERGSLEMQLTTTAGGATYRLFNVSLYLYGYNTYPYVYESNANESKLSIPLATGSYSVELSNWQLQRADTQGVYQQVQATLESSNYQQVTIFNGTTTTLTYSFLTDGVIVSTGQGRLDIAAHVDVADAACTPLGSDCPSGSWCPPASLTGVDLRCLAAGSTVVGHACQSPTECVANASCFSSGGDAFCAALCPSSQFNQPCASGGTCRQVASDYGFCDGADAGSSGAGGSDGGDSDGGSDAGTTTEGLLTQQSPQCVSCARENGCVDPMDIGASCEAPPGGAHGSIDGTRSYQEMCLKTLSDILASGCAVDGQETPCLCGAGVDAVACQNGTIVPQGPIYPDYVADFGSNINSIISNFSTTTYGAGAANVIVQCVAAFGCECF